MTKNNKLFLLLSSACNENSSDHTEYVVVEGRNEVAFTF